MRNILLSIVFVFISIIPFAQTLNNNGAKIQVPSNVNLTLNNFINSGVGAELNYDSDITIKGDWNNTSPAKFNSGTNSSVIFEGTNQQNIRSGGSKFYNIQINNNSSIDHQIILVDDLNVLGNLNLTQGVIATGANYLIIEDGATSNQGNSTSFIDGNIRKIGSSIFIFPVGNINSRDFDNNGTPEYYKVWAPIEIQPSSSTTVGVKYLFGNDGMPDWWKHDGNMDANLHHVSDREHWLVESSVNLSTVKLYWKDNAHNNGDICVHSLCNGNPINYDPLDLSIAYFNNTKWIDLNGTAGGNHNEGYVTSSITIPYLASTTKYVTFASKHNIDPLPIELTKFSSECYNNEVELKWQTASEINAYGYEIERSIDAVNFNKIGFVFASGNSSTILDYDFIDFESVSTTRYYRLKMIDIDGSFKYSNIISNYCYDKNNPIVSVYPNPFHDVIYVRGEYIETEESYIQVFDMIGKLLWDGKIDNTNGMFLKEIKLYDLCPAMYMVRITCGDFITNFKIDKH